MSVDPVSAPAAPRLRRWHALVLALAGVACAVAAVFPQEKAAKVKVAPPQSAGAGLSSLLGSAGGLASLAPLLGSRQPTEVFLAVAKSHEVAVQVAKMVRLLPEQSSPEAEAAALRKLLAKSDINALKGGLIEFQANGLDGPELLAITQAFADVFSERIKAMSLQEAARKQELMQGQLRRASERLVRAQEAMRVFRVNSRLVAPEGIVSSAITLSTTMRARLMAKEVELSTLAQVLTPQNTQYKNVQSEVAELRAKVATLEAQSSMDGMSFGKLSTDTTEYVTLLREQRYAEALFEVFSRYTESLLLEQASAGLNAQIIEAAHLDPTRRLRWPLAMLAGALLVLAGWLLMVTQRAPHRTP